VIPVRDPAAAPEAGGSQEATRSQAARGAHEPYSARGPWAPSCSCFSGPAPARCSGQGTQACRGRAGPHPTAIPSALRFAVGVRGGCRQLPGDRAAVRPAHRGGTAGRGRGPASGGPRRLAGRRSRSRPAEVIAEDPERLREAVESGRSALRNRGRRAAAIIRVLTWAMETRPGPNAGTARGIGRYARRTADPGDRSRAWVPRHPRPGRLTGLFYEGQVSFQPSARPPASGNAAGAGPG